MTLIRAVVRGVDGAPKRTEWLPLGSPEMNAVLLAVLPDPGEDFSVIWETRETLAA
jgi:hypothetical protein